MTFIHSLNRFNEFIDSLPGVIVFFGASALLFPLSRWVFPHIKNVNVVASIHLIFGLILAFVLFKSDILYCLIMAVLTYIGVRFCSVAISNTISAISLLIVYTIVMLRPINWALDMTGLTMVMFQKAVSLSFNLSDGRERKSGKKLVRVPWNDLAVDECPSLFIYFSYVFTPYGSFSNPFLEYKPFIYLLNIGNRKTSDIHPDDHKFAVFRYFGAFLWAGFAYIAMDLISWDSTYNSKWYHSVPIVFRPFICAILTTVQVSRYFPAWWMVESGLYESGLGHSGIGSIEFDHFSSLSMWDTLTSPSTNEWMRRWNHTTHLFWKNYLLTRLLHIGYGKEFSNVMVFVCSMLWHGLKFNFVGALPEAFLCMRADDFWNRKFPQTKDTSIFITTLHHLWVFTSMMYCTSCWYFPDFANFMYVRKSCYFLPDMVAVLIIVICMILPKKKTTIKNEDKKKLN